MGFRVEVFRVEDFRVKGQEGLMAISVGCEGLGLRV